MNTTSSALPSTKVQETGTTRQVQVPGTEYTIISNASEQKRDTDNYTVVVHY
jgi:hypothetical protein